MKKTIFAAYLLVCTCGAFADALLVSADNPSGTGNWNAASFLLSNMGGYFNPGNTGLGPKTPIESFGFYWKNAAGSGAERNALTDANCTIINEGTDFQRDDYIETWNNFESGGVVFKFKIDYRLRPASTTAAVWYLDWKLSNLTLDQQSITLFCLGDLCSRTSSFGNNNLDTVQYSNGLTTFQATGGAPTIYYGSSRPIDTFEISKQTTGSAPACRLKMQNGLVADSLADAVVGSGTGNWAAVYGYNLTIAPGGAEHGSIAVGMNKAPVFLTGKVNFGTLAPDAVYPIPVAIEIREAGTTNVLESRNADVYADGSYDFVTSLPAGQYDVAFKGSHWLRRVTTGVTIPAGGQGIANVELINGDSDGNNFVNTDDYLLLSDNFDDIVDAGTKGDLDQNGWITTDDYLILNESFDLSGEE
jgi:hypothetical protein